MLSSQPSSDKRGALMDLAYVKKLLKLLSESDADEIEIEEEGKRIRVAKHPAAAQPAGPSGAQIPLNGTVMMMAGTPTAVPAPAAGPAPAVVEPPPAQNLHEIRSPIVGTFYRAPAPDAAPFVQQGSPVEPGSVLCIVEAMKLMNEIESDVTGTIIKVLVENGQPVEYDQPLFLVEKS